MALFGSASRSTLTTFGIPICALVQSSFSSRSQASRSAFNLVSHGLGFLFACLVFFAPLRAESRTSRPAFASETIPTATG